MRDGKADNLLDILFPFVMVSTVSRIPRPPASLADEAVHVPLSLVFLCCRG